MSKILTQIALSLWGIAPGNYSAITPIEGSTYAIVDDKDSVDGYRLLTLQLEGHKGKIVSAQLVVPEGMRQRRAAQLDKVRDCEGACFVPSAGTVFVSGEANQDILEYDLDGNPTGRQLAVPECMSRARISPNLGFESLTYNAAQHRFWTTTEGMLPDDAVEDSSIRLRLLSFDDQLQPSASYVYQVDPPTKVQTGGIGVHGVPSMLALDNGKMLVLEREAYSPKRKIGAFVNHKIYIVDLTQESSVPLSTPMSEVTNEQIVRKELLVEFKTRFNLFRRNLANYEGMCLGPRLDDGRQTLLLISDSQQGMGNRFFHLKDYIGVIILNQDLTPPYL